MPDPQTLDQEECLPQALLCTHVCACDTGGGTEPSPCACEASIQPLNYRSNPSQVVVPFDGLPTAADYYHRWQHMRQWGPRTNSQALGNPPSAEQNMGKETRTLSRFKYNTKI